MAYPSKPKSDEERAAMRAIGYCDLCGFNLPNCQCAAQKYIRRKRKEQPKLCKHTPGPWRVKADKRVGPYGFYIVVVCDEGYEFEDAMHVAGTGRSIVVFDDEEVRANANLIAAAPDLLEACRATLLELESLLAVAAGRIDNMEYDGDDVARAIHGARAAIVKATGEPDA